MSRTKLRVHPERAAPDEVASILEAGVVAHVALADHRGPVVIPMIYHFDRHVPRCLYLHGAPHSSLLEAAAQGVPMCVTVTLLDGLVYSRTALYHSVNYRSVVCFGRARLADSAESVPVLHALLRRYFPEREPGRDFEPMPNAHVDATVLLAMEIEDASAKARRGGPKGPRDGDATAPGSAGVIELPRVQLPLAG
jgi:uncharacterized protein